MVDCLVSEADRWTVDTVCELKNWEMTYAWTTRLSFKNLWDDTFQVTFDLTVTFQVVAIAKTQDTCKSMTF